MQAKLIVLQKQRNLSLNNFRWMFYSSALSTLQTQIFEVIQATTHMIRNRNEIRVSTSESRRQKVTWSPLQNVSLTLRGFVNL